MAADWPNAELDEIAIAEAAGRRTKESLRL
jgi:hypothetical protein